MSFPLLVRSLRARTASLPLVLLLAGLSACGAPAAQRPAATTPSPSATSAAPALPPGTFVSESWRIALRPAAGWRILDRDETRAVNPSAAVVAVREREPGKMLVLVVGALGDISRERMADLVLQSVHLDGARVLARDRTRIAGTEAVRVQTEGQREGLQVQLGALVFEHQGFGYQVVASGIRVDDPAVQRLLAGLEILPGEVQPEWSVPETREAVGSDWRVRAGRFESAASGLTIAPGSQWRLIPPTQLPSFNADAEVGLVARNPEMYLMLIPERVPPAQQAHFRRTILALSAARVGRRAQEEDVTIPFDGRPLSLAAYSHGGVRYLLGMQCEGEVCTQVLVWWTGGTSATVHRLLTESPPTFGRLSAGDRATLLRELRAIPSTSRVAGMDFSLRNGRYVHYPSGTTLRLPADAGWNVRAGDAARTTIETLSLYLNNRALGLAGSLLMETLDQPLSDAEYHAQVRAVTGMGDAAVRPVRRQFGRMAGLVSEADVTPNGLNFRQRMITVVRGNLGIRLMVSALPDVFEAARDAVDAAMAGFEVASAPLAPNEQDGERWSDSQFGYTLRVPRVFQHTDHTSFAERGIVRSQSWTRGDSGIAVSAVALPEAGASGALEQLLQHLRTRLPGLPRGIEWEPSTLAGRPARRQVWRHQGMHFEFILLELDRMAYTVFMVDPEPGGMRPVLQSFELLE
jgi:hypothetical protein